MPVPLSARVALVALIAGLLASVVEPLLPDDGVGESQPFVDAVRARAPELLQGDLVLVHPPWRDDVLDALEGALPAGVRASTALALPHGDDPGRVLVVLDGGAPPLPRAQRERLSREQRHGAVISGWLAMGDGAAAGAREREPGSGDIARRIEQATVHVERADGSVVPCPWRPSSDRHVCTSLPSWMYVGLEPVLVGGAPSRCVWSHPVTGGKVVIRFENITLGDELRLGHALSDTAAAHANGAAVTAEIFVDDKSLGRSTRSNARGWRRESFPVPSPGVPVSLALEITTPDDGARHYCWTLESPRGGEP